MDNFRFALDGAWQVLVVGVILGAGLPAIFALGIRALALGSSGVAVESHGSVQEQPSALGKALAGLCFAVVVLAVAVGITIIVASGLGKDVTFSHVYPQIVDKA